MNVELWVPGQPVPQPRHKVAARGRFAHAYIPAGHGIHAYRLAVQAAAKAAGIRPLSGPVEVEIECVFARPKSHLGGRGGVVLKKNAPAWPPKSDWDNLAKGVCDALTGIAWDDDDQVVDGRCRKRYALPGEAAGTRVVVRSP